MSGKKGPMVVNALKANAESISVEDYLDALLSRPDIASERRTVSWLAKITGLENTQALAVFNDITQIMARERSPPPQVPEPAHGEVKIAKQKAAELTSASKTHKSIKRGMIYKDLLRNFLLTVQIPPEEVEALILKE